MPNKPRKSSENELKNAQNSPKTDQKSSKIVPKTAKNTPKRAQTPPEATKGSKVAHTAPRQNYPVWALLTALIVVVGGGFLFVGAAAGWFSGPQTVTLDAEYYTASSPFADPSNPSPDNQDGDFLELLTAEKYQELVDAQKSFLLFVDQTNCSNADRLRGYIADYAAETGVKPYRIMFSTLKDTPLYDQVKYYPSVVLVSDGQPVQYLDPSSDADTEEYNDYAAFKTWLDQSLKH